MNRFQITSLPDGRFLLIDHNAPRVASRTVNGRTQVYMPRFALEVTRGSCNCGSPSPCAHIEAVRVHTDKIHAIGEKSNITPV